MSYLGKDWVFETKWDGIRLITEKRGNHTNLASCLLP
jgi:ATP-dependent DNA ligase